LSIISPGTPLAITSIDLYQAVIIAKATQSATQKTFMSYYPCSSGETGTAARLYETRYALNAVSTKAGQAVSGVTASATLGPTVIYGISIHDLKTVTGSGYRNVMAIMADDGGIDSQLGWTSDTADGPYRTEGRTNPFAFSLYGVRIIDAVGTVGGAAGELMLGRKPRWSIWNDSIPNRGLWVREYGTVNTEMRFNLFAPFMYYSSVLGTLTPVLHLHQYIGFSTQASRIAVPRFVTDPPSSLSFDICNGTMVRCINRVEDKAPWPSDNTYTRFDPVAVTNGRVSRSRLWPRFYTGEDMRGSYDDRNSTLRTDSKEVIYVNDGHEHDLDPITVAMGNIIDWEDTGTQTATRARFYGVGLVMYDASRTPGFEITRTYEYMRGVVTESSYLGAATDAEVKKAYKSDGKPVTMSFLPGKADELALYLTSNESKDCLIEMALALRPTVADSDELTHCNRLLAARPITLNRSSLASEYRCVLMTPTVEISDGTNTRTCNVVFGQVDHSNMSMHTRLSNGNHFLFPFFLHYTDANQSDRLVSAGSVSGFTAGGDGLFQNGFGTNRKVVMCIQVSYISNGTIKRLRYKAKCGCAATKSGNTLTNDFYGNYTKYGAHDEIDLSNGHHAEYSSNQGVSYNRGTFIGDLTLYQEFMQYYSSNDWSYRDVSLTDIEGIAAASTNWQPIYLYYFIGHMYMDGATNAVIPENSTVQVWLYQDNKVPSEWSSVTELS
ncbi:MAG: hypothetical protein MJY66_04955, partial [Bacteroidaceae bacterium]|nr:hypothetical protein [Bacteroidaceae bacterium]